ncbi:MAG: nuclear transport factor 2 family protein [Nibricoccus sp.]
MRLRLVAHRQTLCALLFFVLPFARLRAADDAVIALVKAADDARVAAMIGADANQLDQVLSDQLHYAHSVSKTEDKPTHIANLTSRRLIYQSFDYKTRDFSVAAPGVVVMKGQALVKVGSKKMIFLVDINYLAVWRLERDHWCLYAWQSTRNTEPTPIGPYLPDYINPAEEKSLPPPRRSVVR